MSRGQRALTKGSLSESEQKTQSQTLLKCMSDMEDCDILQRKD